jgi:hypothetical protein
MSRVKSMRFPKLSFLNEVTPVSVLVGSIKVTVLVAALAAVNFMVTAGSLLKNSVDTVTLVKSAADRWTLDPDGIKGISIDAMIDEGILDRYDLQKFQAAGGAIGSVSVVGVEKTPGCDCYKDYLISALFSSETCQKMVHLDLGEDHVETIVTRLSGVEFSKASNEPALQICDGNPVWIDYRISNEK